MRAAIASASCALLVAGCGAAQERSAPDPPAALARVGAQVDVSNEAGRQREVSIAVDPNDDAVLLAGSNSRPGSTMRAYASTDGGARWTSAALPVPPASTSDGCAADPAVGIDRAGRQYFAFGWISPCTFFGRASIFVATRADAHAPWLTPAAPVAPHDTNAFDDKPALAIDNSPQSRHPNRVYVAWTRDGGRSGDLILVSHSDDGVNWSTPVRANHTFSQGLSYASLAVGGDGDVYVAWDDWIAGALYLTRSSDGGDHFEPERFVAHAVPGTLRCRPYGTAIPAQARTCVRANPIVSVDRSTGPFAGRTYVTFARTGANGAEDVFVSAFDGALQPLAGFPRRVNRPDGPVRSDQFWPASAVDQATGALWVCFYDTSGDPRRVKTFYSCTASTDGGRSWARAVRAASVASNERQAAAASGPYGGEYGDYEGLAVANGVAHPIWTDSRRLSTRAEEIYTTALRRP